MTNTVDFLQPVSGDADIVYTAAQFRQLPDDVWSTPGTINEGDLVVAQRGAGANLTVDVAAGNAAVQATTAGLGKYLIRADAVQNVNCGSSPGTGLKRIDSIVAIVMDKESDGNTNVGSAAYTWLVVCVQGAAVAIAGTASPPSLPSGIGFTVGGYLELARISRTNGEVSIVNSAITSVRALVVPAGVGSRTVAHPPIGLGTYDPAKPVLVYSDYVEIATDASGFLNIATPATPTCIVTAVGTYVYRQAPIPTVGAFLFRLDGSTLSSLRWQFRNLTDGSVIASQFVGFWYRLEYQV